MDSKVESLCNASARGDLEKVLYLLQEGADINGRNKYKRTPLQVSKHLSLYQTFSDLKSN